MWHDIVGHDAIVERFRGMAASDRLASTYLFSGPAGVGKRTLAERIAQALLCEDSPGPLEFCGACEACRLSAAGTHPDLDVVSKPPERSYIPLDLLIGDKDHRMREGLCHRISLKPFRGRRKIAVIDDADDLNQEGANCLLKTLEEPPPRSIIILISTSAAGQLPTIRSRSQLVLFAPLRPEEVARLLMERGIVEDEAAAQRLADQCGGSIDRAQRLADQDTGQFCQAWTSQLAAPSLDPLAASKTVTEFVESAGSQAADRRARLRLAAELAADFYRGQMREGCRAESDPAADRSAMDPGVAADAVLRCLQTIQHVDRNANQANVIAAWIDDLVRLSTGQYVSAEL